MAPDCAVRTGGDAAGCAVRTGGGVPDCAVQIGCADAAGCAVRTEGVAHDCAVRTGCADTAGCAVWTGGDADGCAVRTGSVAPDGAVRTWGGPTTPSPDSAAGCIAPCLDSAIRRYTPSPDSAAGCVAPCSNSAPGSWRRRGRHCRLSCSGRRDLDPLRCASHGVARPGCSGPAMAGVLPGCCSSCSARKDPRMFISNQPDKFRSVTPFYVLRKSECSQDTSQN
jgi:hypothetical protein